MTSGRGRRVNRLFRCPRLSFCVVQPSRLVHPASAARMRAQLRVPLWKLVRSYFSLGE